MTWRVSDGRLLDKLTEHVGTIEHLAFSPDGTRLATSSREGRLTCWQTGGAKLLWSAAAPNNVVSLGFAADSAAVFSASPSGTINLFDAAEGKHLSCKAP